METEDLLDIPTSEVLTEIHFGFHRKPGFFV